MIPEFYAAFGQYRTYAHLLSKIEPERELFLAVSSTVFNDFFQLETIQEIARKDGLSLLAVNIQTEPNPGVKMRPKGTSRKRKSKFLQFLKVPTL